MARKDQTESIEWPPKFSEWEESTDSMEELVRLILHCPELRLNKFDTRIDYER